MISHERFEERLKWLSNVTGSAIRRETSEALWEEVRNVDIRDFEAGVKSLAYTDEKINLNNLWRHIGNYQSKRLEREAIEFKRNEEDEFRRWWQDHGGSRHNCVNEFKCFECKRDYCDVLSKDATRCIKEVVRDGMTDEAMNEYMSKYKGMGWTVPELEPF